MLHAISFCKINIFHIYVSHKWSGNGDYRKENYIVQHTIFDLTIISARVSFNVFRSISLLLWFIFSEITGFKSGLECLPSGSGTDAAGHCTAACILGIHGDAVLLTLSQSALNALFDLALVRFAGGDALHAHRAAWHFFAAVFHVDLVTAAVIRQIGRFVFTVAEVLHLYPARHLIRSLKQFKESLIEKLQFINRSLIIAWHSIHSFVWRELYLLLHVSYM